MVREGGGVLARQPPTSIDRRSDRLDVEGAFLAALQTNRERGTFESGADADGGPRQAAYRRIAGRPIYIAADIESEAIRAAWQADVAKQAAFAIPAALALLLLSLAALRIAEREQASIAPSGPRVRSGPMPRTSCVTPRRWRRSAA